MITKVTRHHLSGRNNTQTAPWPLPLTPPWAPFLQSHQKWLETDLLLGWKFARRLPDTGGGANGWKSFTCELEEYPPSNEEKAAASKHRGLNLHHTGYGAPRSRAPTDRAHRPSASRGGSTGGDALRGPAGPTEVTVPAAEAARMGGGPGQPLTRFFHLGRHQKAGLSSGTLLPVAPASTGLTRRLGSYWILNTHGERRSSWWARSCTEPTVLADLSRDGNRSTWVAVCFRESRS